MKVIAALIAAPLVAQQPATSGNPDSARLVSTDIVRFWRAFDAGATGAVFQHMYIDSGSVGVHDFIPGRIESGDNVAEVVASHRRFYAAIRGSTLAIDGDQDQGRHPRELADRHRDIRARRSDADR